MQVKQSPPMTALTFSTATTLSQLSQFIAVTARGLHQEAVRLGVDVMGPIYWTYYGATGDPNNVFQLEIALPVSEAKGEPSDFSFRRIDSFKCVADTLDGPWENLGGFYSRFIPQTIQQGHQLSGVIREMYVHMDLAEPVNNITEVQLGIL
jgi:hypothetical protein